MAFSKTLKTQTTSRPIEQGVRFDDVFEAGWPRVHRLLVSIVGDPAAAEDLALEAFWRLYRRPSLLNAGQKPLAWLFRVAANLGYNHLRAQKRRGSYETAAAADPTVLSGSDPEVSAGRSLEIAQVREILAAMRPRDARLLLLRHAGLSYIEVAEVIGVAAGSVGSLLSRAERDFELRYRRRFGDDEM